MNLVNRIKTWAGMERRADGYTNAAIEALLSAALGTGSQPSGTAAVATAVQAISSPIRHLHCQRGPGVALSVILGGPGAAIDDRRKCHLLNRR